MRPVSAQSILALLCASLAGCGGSSETTTTPKTSGAQSGAPEPGALPAAEAVLDGFVEATGGRAAYQKVKTRVATGTFAVTSMKEPARFSMYQAAPKKMYLVIDLPGLGKEERGTDGTVAWSRSGMTGNRIVEGAERDQMLRTAALHGEILWRELYTKAETVGVMEVGGRKAYKVTLHTPEGSLEHRYYDVENKLLLRTSLVERSPMGGIPVDSLSSDYRKVGDLLLSHKAVIRAMNMEQVLTMEKIEHNVPIDPARFAVPSDVRAVPSGEPSPGATKPDAK